MYQDVGVLEFGTSNITVMIARSGINNTFDIKGKAEVPYRGFLKGEFLGLDSLKSDVATAIKQAESQARTRIKDMFVGVPGDFTSAIAKDVSISFDTKQRITQKEVTQLQNAGDTYDNERDYKVINRSPIYYEIDDKKMIDPKGKTSTKLSGKVSYILVEKSHLRLMRDIFSNYDFNVEYISSVLAEGLFLFEPDLRDRYAILCDVGYHTTSVALFQGDGILYMKSFGRGGSTVELGLVDALKIEPQMAQKLKRKVELSLNVNDTDQYFVDIGNGKQQTKFSAKFTHQVVRDKIEDIASHVKYVLDECPEAYPKFTQVYLTGGGISYIRGAKELMSLTLNREVNILDKNLPQYNKPHEIAEFGLLDSALKNFQPRKSFLSKLFK